MFDCCLNKIPEIVQTDSFEINLEKNLNLPDKIYFYQILISRLLEASNYLINSGESEHCSLAFIYYFYVLFGCNYLINNNLDKFIEYFDLETDISNILELLISIKYCLKPNFDFLELDSIGIFIIKIDEKTIFDKVNMFSFKIDNNSFYENFIQKYKNIKNSDFEKMKAYLRTLMISIDHYILKKFLSKD